jgi:Ca2+/Na+ antiporter
MVPEGALWNGRVVPFFILGTILFVFNLLTQNINLLTSKFQGHIFLSLIYLVISFFLLFNYYSRWNDRYEVTALFIIALFLILYFSNVNKLNQLFSFLLISLTISTVSLFTSLA